MHDQELQLDTMGPETCSNFFLNLSFFFSPSKADKLSASRTLARVCVCACVWPQNRNSRDGVIASPRLRAHIPGKRGEKKWTNRPPSRSFRRSLAVAPSKHAAFGHAAAMRSPPPPQAYHTQAFDILLRALRPNGTGIGPVWRPAHGIERQLCVALHHASSPPPLFPDCFMPAACRARARCI
ncbi:hypothetical protein LZ30DRAFT_13935 [Colletotrichum cereale]|nr:hypothetical protein LZ30DRAFT_13935 [Colletotrichum cereale]